MHLQQELELAGPTMIDLRKVSFDPIDEDALGAFEQWDDPHFSWREVIEWKAREPLALDIAIWFESELCGLCFANPNGSRQRIRIVRLEGRPTEIHPLKNRIAPLAILVIEQYARTIGSTWMEAQEPFEGAVPVYQLLGFYFDNEGRLVKPLETLVS